MFDAVPKVVFLIKKMFVKLKIRFQTTQRIEFLLNRPETQLKLENKTFEFLD